MKKQVIFYLVFGLAWLYADLGPQTYTSSAPKTSFEYQSFEETANFNRQDLAWNGQSSSWQKQMKKLATTIKQNDVASVYFVHGTFVGNDPFGTVAYLKKTYRSY